MAQIAFVKKLYTLEETVQLSIPIWKGYVKLEKSITFCKNGQPYMTIKNNGIVIFYKGYTWDGCTPKLNIFGKKIGTPDGPIRPNGFCATYFASLLHDGLYEALDHPARPFTRKDADQAFLYLMKLQHFKWHMSYYYFVRIFGRQAHRISNRTSNKPVITAYIGVDNINDIMTVK